MTNENKNEIRNYINILCEMTNKSLDQIVNENNEYLPMFIVFNAHACYVRYDTQEENITHVTLEVINRVGHIIEIDPVEGVISGVLEDEPSCTVKMKKHTASILLRCISVFWKKRLKEEGLISLNSDGRFIVADLLA